MYSLFLCVPILESLMEFLVGLWRVHSNFSSGAIIIFCSVYNMIHTYIHSYRYIYINTFIHTYCMNVIYLLYTALVIYFVFEFHWYIFSPDTCIHFCTTCVSLWVYTIVYVPSGFSACSALAYIFISYQYISLPASCVSCEGNDFALFWLSFVFSDILHIFTVICT